MKKKETELYRYFNDKGSLLYVGISLSAVYRACQHKSVSHWYKYATKIDIQRFDSRGDALSAEREAIKKESPIYNLMHNKKEETPFEYPDGVNSKSADARNLIRSAVYKPIYTEKEVAQMLYGDSSLGVKKIKSLIDSSQMGGILVSEREYKNAHGNISNIKKYNITGWQLISFIEALESGDVSL